MRTAIERSPMMNAGKASRHRSENGFSLIEIMVAVSLLAIIMVALLMAFQQVQRAFRLGANQVDVLENGRAMMNMFSRDFQEMTFLGLPGPYQNFYAERTPGSSPKSLDLQDGRSLTVLLQDVFFLTRYNDDCASIRYALLEDLADIGVATLYRKVTNGAWVDAPLIATNSLAIETVMLGANVNPAYHRVVEGVVHFRLEAFDKQGNPMLATNAPGEVVIQPMITGLPYLGYSFSHTNLPAFIDIELGILEPQTYGQFKARLQASPANASAFLKARAGKVHLFRQRIPIRSQSRIET